MLLHPFLPQKKLFKAYDIRGDMQWFSDDFLWVLARGFAQLFVTHGTRYVAIGYDVRHHSAAIAKFLAYACERAGLSVQWLGQVTTPMMAFLASQYDGNGLMVTASHSEKAIHGIKWLVNHKSPSSDDITALYDRLATLPIELTDDGLLGEIRSLDYPAITEQVFTAYQQGMVQALQQATVQLTANACTVRPYRLVIDCLNGATAVFAKAVFERIGHTCVMLNDTRDGNFPKGNPDPTEPSRLQELSQAVIAYQADIGLAFDGDGDRLMIVNDRGQVIAPDYLLYLLARVAVEASPSWVTPQVIFDVKCSHHVPALLTAQGAIPVMEKTGSSLMRQSLQSKSRQAVFAGELSGHFLFNDGYFVLYDDAMYAAARLVHWLQHQPQTLNQLLDTLPQCVTTSDMYLPIANTETGQTIVNRLVQLSQKSLRGLKQAAVKNINTIDGLRLDFAHGFGILRRSNTGNFLTVRFCGDTLKDLQQVQTVFVGLCRSIDDELAKQVASIQPC